MIRRLRWRLAHRFAPVPIMADPFPEAEALVVYRKDGCTVAIQLTQMRLRMTSRRPSWEELESADPYAYVPSKTLVRLVGTIER